jgi:phosphatidylglycerophosphatase A
VSLKAAETVATLGGVGRVPGAPGTAGSLAALLALAPLAGHPEILWPAAAALAALAVWSAGAVARNEGRRDPKMIVVDEAVGMAVVVAGLPSPHWTWMAGGLALFRVIDILKPPPLRRLELLPGGYGIVADDAAAGAYTLLVLWLLRVAL